MILDSLRRQRGGKDGEARSGRFVKINHQSVPRGRHKKGAGACETGEISGSSRVDQTKQEKGGKKPKKKKIGRKKTCAGEGNGSQRGVISLLRSQQGGQNSAEGRISG